MVKLVYMPIFTEIIWKPEEKSSRVLTFIESRKLAHDVYRLDVYTKSNFPTYSHRDQFIPQKVASLFRVKAF